MSAHISKLPKPFVTWTLKFASKNKTMSRHVYFLMNFKSLLWISCVKIDMSDILCVYWENPTFWYYYSFMIGCVSFLVFLLVLNGSSECGPYGILVLHGCLVYVLSYLVTSLPTRQPPPTPRFIRHKFYPGN